MEAASVEPATSKELHFSSKAKGKQKAYSAYGESVPSTKNSKVFFRRRSLGVRGNVSRRGLSRSGDKSELLAKWPLDALLVSDLSFSSSNEAFSTDFFNRSCKV